MIIDDKNSAGRMKQWMCDLPIFSAEGLEVCVHLGFIVKKLLKINSSLSSIMPDLSYPI
ncbi:hypothetical protein AAGG52_17505 [Bacillus licheniformis]